MPKLKGFVSLVLIAISISIGLLYWFNQQQHLESFVQQVESIKVNPNSSLEPKDYIATKNNLIALQSNLNTSTFQLVSSLLFFVTAYTAWLNLVSSERKQIAERLAKAVDQLGNDELSVRVGGIFLLEQIAQNSPEDHWTVMEILTSYIRDQSLKGKSVFKPKIEDAEENQVNEYSIESVLKKIRAELEISVTTDIQAALTVICRRKSNQDPKSRVIDLSFCDIRGCDLENAKLNSADLRGSNLSGANLQNANLSCANLEGVNLTLAVINNATLEKTKLNNALLDSAYLNNAKLQYTDLTNAQFKSANLQGAKLNHSTLHFASLVNAKLQGADLSQANFNLTDMKGSIIDNKTKINRKWKLIHDINTKGAKDSQLDGIDFSGAVLTFADFEGASLNKAIFNGANLSQANFKNACLEGASFLKTNIRTKLDGAYFSGANLKGAIFKEASLICTNFTGEVPQSTNLTEITFEEVYFADTEFQNVLLEKADFIRAIFQGVNFCLANLSEAKFDSCSYERAEFKQANLDKTIFTGSLKGTDFRNSNFQSANFKNADKTGSQFS